MRLVFVLLVLACGSCKTLPAGVGFPLRHADFTGTATCSPGDCGGGRAVRVSTDDCDERYAVLIRLGPRCALRATWVGEPKMREDLDTDPLSWREGVVSIEAGAPCVLERAPGDAVTLRVGQGTAVIAGRLIEVSLDGTLAEPRGSDPAGARATFQLKGVLDARRSADPCPAARSPAATSTSP